MPRFKHKPKNQKSDLSISTSQGTESTCLPINLPPPIQHAPQPTRPVYSASHPNSMDQDTPHSGPTVCLESQPSRSVHLTSHPSPVGRDSLQPSHSVHSTSHLVLSNQDSSQSSRSIHSTSHSDPTNEDSSQAAPTNQAALKKILDVNQIYSRNDVKKIKVKAKEVLNLTGEERIVVKFDIYDEPFGEARSLLSHFCGILACDCSLFPINFEKLSNLPVTYFNRVFDHIIKKMRRNRENQKKQTIPHTGGSKANATRSVEMMAETGQWPGRAQMYIATHKNQDGAYVNEATKEICEKIESTLSQSTTDESQVSPNDVVGKVLGQEHFRRVRCLGLGSFPRRIFQQVTPYFGSTSASISGGSYSFQCRENYNQMMNSHNQILSALKAYMILKEKMIPEQFVGLFDSPSMVSPTTPSDASSGSISPMDARIPRDDSDPNDGH
ncbi:uncharacterized protein LOC107865301 [Capsicum annuum]|uniref:uncharacterized protein LOC107865301 n=1 Tax=Capsicum annuum TaxID=4072 RepID=UPI001FB0A028|nr:uncharacterized protein LOC107865301 [Capsicum annuum]